MELLRMKMKGIEDSVENISMISEEGKIGREGEKGGYEKLRECVEMIVGLVGIEIGKENDREIIGFKWMDKKRGIRIGINDMDWMGVIGS